MATQSVVQTSDGIFTEQNGWPAQGQWRYADYLRYAAKAVSGFREQIKRMFNVNPFSLLV